MNVLTTSYNFDISAPGGFAQHAAPSTTYQRLPAEKFGENFEDDSDKLCALMDVFGPEKAKRVFKEKYGDPKSCSMSQECVQNTQHKNEGAQLSSPLGSPMRLIEFSGRGRPPTTHSPIHKDANFVGKDVPSAMPETRNWIRGKAMP